MPKQIKTPPIQLIDGVLIVSVLKIVLILVFVEEKILFRWIVGPYLFNTFVYVAVVLDFLQVLNHFERRAGPSGIVNQFLFRSRPWCILKFGCELKCPIHSFINIYALINNYETVK